VGSRKKKKRTIELARVLWPLAAMGAVVFSGGRREVPAVQESSVLLSQRLCIPGDFSTWCVSIPGVARILLDVSDEKSLSLLFFWLYRTLRTQPFRRCSA
jgi:hypothetical protein